MSKPHLSKEKNTSPELEDYVRRTESTLDLIALLTLWVVLIPFRSFGSGASGFLFAVGTKLMVSLVFAIDMVRRSRRAPQPWTYVWGHPIGLLAIILPPIRVLFSLRLVTSLFRRGHLAKFLAADFLLLINGALIVYFYERETPGANITTLGDAAWWAIVTVTTVGYGDLYPVSPAGQIAAACVMAAGILTLAVITAQVSWSFTQQVDDRPRSSSPTTLEPESLANDPADSPQELAGLHDRLDGIEAQLKRLLQTFDSVPAAQPVQGPTASDGTDFGDSSPDSPVVQGP
ncbi:MAG: ion channel [Microthrixaceae bacterium]